MPFAVITGASGAIGAAIAKRLVSDLDYHGMAAENEMPVRLPGWEPFKLDLSSMTGNLEWTAGDQGIDLVVHAAGMNAPGEIPPWTAWDEVLNVNLSGPAKLNQLLLPRLTHGSSIIFISSISGQIGGPISPHYAAAKAGIIALTRTLARQLVRREIRVNCIAPGWIETAMGSPSLAREWSLTGKQGTVNDVVEAALFLADPKRSGYFTGQTICPNGGAYFAG